MVLVPKALFRGENCFELLYPLVLGTERWLVIEGPPRIVRIWNIDITQGGLKLSVFPLTRAERDRIYGRLVQSMVHLSSTVKILPYGAFADLKSSHYMVLRSSTWPLLS
jgi:hypothetical protein